MKFKDLKNFTLAILILGISYSVYENITTKDSIAQSDIKILPYELTGNKNSEYLLIFLHGFPNTFRLWDKMIKDLESDYYCLNISYPNFSDKIKLKWGMDLKDIADLIKDTIDQVEQNSQGNKNYKKVLISHDWGAFFTYLLSQKYENYFADIVSMDVGAGIEDSLRAKTSVLAYQGYLISNFLIGGRIGKFLTRLFVNSVDTYGLSKEDLERLDSSWNYPYYHMWRNINYYRNILSNFEVKTPIAYVYGNQKKFNFHNEKFLNQLKNCAQCEVHSLDSDHWIMRKPENLKFLVDLIRRRLKYFK